MNESSEQKHESELDNKFRSFDDIDEDNWADLVSEGVPLLKAFKEAQDPRVEYVSNTLSYTKNVILGSGAGDPERKQAMIASIEEALAL